MGRGGGQGQHVMTKFTLTLLHGIQTSLTILNTLSLQNMKRKRERKEREEKKKNEAAEKKQEKAKLLQEEEEAVKSETYTG